MAAESDEKKDYFNDGSYIITEFEATEIQGISRAWGTAVSKSKSITYYTASGTAQWKYTISGTFAYNGLTSMAKSVSQSTTIYNTAWYVASNSTTYSGNTINGTITCKKSNFGIATTSIIKSISLTCDKDGNFS